MSRRAGANTSGDEGLHRAAGDLGQRRCRCGAGDRVVQRVSTSDRCDGRNLRCGNAVRDWVSRLVLAMRRPRHQLCSHRRQALIAMALPRIQPIIPTRLAAATSMRAIRRARISSPAQRARLPSRKQASTNRTPRRRILPTTASTRPGGARRMIVTESGKSRRWVVKTNQMKYYCTERLAIAECTGVARGSRLWRKLELRRSHFAAVPRFCLLNVFG